ADVANFLLRCDWSTTGASQMEEAVADTLANILAARADWSTNAQEINVDNLINKVRTLASISKAIGGGHYADAMSTAAELALQLSARAPQLIATSTMGIYVHLVSKLPDYALSSSTQGPWIAHVLDPVAATLDPATGGELSKPVAAQLLRLRS